MVAQHHNLPERNTSNPSPTPPTGTRSGNPSVRKAPDRFLTLSRWALDDNYRGSHGPVGGEAARVESAVGKTAAGTSPRLAMEAKLTSAGAKANTGASGTPRAPRIAH
jgi:hypothetical protein